jgi:hypothetical protein
MACIESIRGFVEHGFVETVLDYRPEKIG